MAKPVPDLVEPQEPLPGWGDASLRLALAALVALQLFALARLEGYQLADSVEYLDRARQVAEGHPLDPGSVRSFAFSALFLPLFWVRNALGLDSYGFVLGAARALQMLFALQLVVVTARVGTRLFGRRSGLLAAWVLAVNPILLQWSIEPLSGTAAALFSLLGLEAAARSGSWKRGMLAGAWFGLALLMAFQTILVSGVILPLVFLRDLRRRWRFPLGCALGFALLIGVQGLLDLWVYGAFASSLMAYLAENFAGTVGGFFYRIGFKDSAMMLYDWLLGYAGGEDAPPRIPRQRMPATWYLTELPVLCLAWPFVAVLLVGLGRAVCRPRWGHVLFLGLFAISATMMSNKGAKSFRLWLPLLPILAVYAGAGLGSLWGPWERTGGARRLFAGLVLVLGIAGSVHILLDINLEKHGGFWRAVEIVQEEGAPTEEEPLRLGASWFWAVSLRAGSAIEVHKLSYPLDSWSVFPQEAKERVASELETLDWFVAHLQTLRENPDLLVLVNRRFEIERVLYDRSTYEELAPIFVLRERTGRESARTFFELLPEETPESVEARLGYPRRVDFARREEERTLELDFLGFDLQTGLDGARQAWITYTWQVGELGGRSFLVGDRFTDFNGRLLMQNNHPLAYGALGPDALLPGTLFQESFLLVIPEEPVRYGGPWYRGDVVPSRLWLSVIEANAEGTIVGGLSPFQPSGARPIDRRREGPGLVSADGRRWSRDSLIDAGGFDLPIPGPGLADDGRQFAPD